MLLLAALLLSEPARGESRLDFQLMTSAAFERFATRADRTCRSRRLRYLTPADLELEQESFEHALSPVARRRLAAHDKGFKGCGNTDGGLSCPAQHTLDAMIALKLLDRFTRFACHGRDQVGARRRP